MANNGKMQLQVPLQDGDLIVDNSILESMICDTRAGMRHGVGYTDKDEAVELKSGSAMHEALATWLVTRGDETAAAKRLTTAYKTWAQGHVPPDHRLAYSPLMTVLQVWMGRNKVDKLPWVVNPQTVEMAASAVLVDDDLGRIIFVALLDAIGERRQGGGIWPADHKTTGRLTDWWVRGQHARAQYTGHVWLMKQHGLPCGGVFVNALSTAVIPGSDRRCTKHGTKYSECGPGHVETQLFPTMRSPNEVEAWARTARALAKKFRKMKLAHPDIHDVRQMKQQGRFFGGCTFCTFQEWCRIGRPVQGVGNFALEPWNPLEHAQRRGGVKG